MSHAIASIVDGYVSLKDRMKLEGLRAQRQRLRRMLQDSSGGPFDASVLIMIMDEELEVIESALKRL